MISLLLSTSVKTLSVPRRVPIGVPISKPMMILKLLPPTNLKIIGYSAKHFLLMSMVVDVKAAEEKVMTIEIWLWLM